MSSTPVCPECGAGLPVDKTDGLCPRCLLQLAVLAKSGLDTEPMASQPITKIGEQFGPYTTVRLLGQGGMGVVYLAEQQQPIQRTVALKVIKTGLLDTRDVLRRFESERAALALMDHPNIARMFEVGTSVDGRPWFAMEYFPGLPITAYCDRNQLNNRERLELFIPICQAMQHAHQKGVIHRDIKPSNVLVSLQDGRHVAKVIDFGVAKATSQALSERTIFTEHGLLIGTPEYMSPEQANLPNQNVDTTTDVYSLGVLLYELLVGALPFEGKFLRRAGLAEMIRVISQEVPLTPSAKITELGELAVEVAQRRRTNPPHLRSQLDGDLNWIVMKALEKDRSRRYASMSEFAADVERHLSDQPVLAGPPNPLYRGYKFARRHRISVVAGLLVAVSLIAGVISTGWQARVAVLQRDRADAEAAAARKSRAAAQTSEQDAKRSEAKAQESLAGLLNAQAELQQGLEVQKRLTREARVRELVADAAQWQSTDPALALYLGWRVAQMERRLPPGLEDVLATSLANGPAYKVWRGRADLVAWSPDWKTLASVGEDRVSIVLSDPANGRTLRTLRRPARREVTSVAWSPDGNFLASANYDGYILSWNVASGDIIHTLQNSVSPGLGGPSRVTWSPDGKILAAATWEPKKIRPAPPAPPVTGTIRLWAAASGQPLRTLQSDYVHSLTWSPDGRLLASSGGGRTIQLWDVASGERVQAISGYSARTIAWSPDGKILASAGEDRTIRLLDPASGRLVRGMEGHRDSIHFVTWSPDGRMLATASGDRTIRLWDVASGEALHTFRGHRNNVSGLTWSLDGRTLASAGEDRTIRFWDTSKPQFDAIENSRSKMYGYNRVAVWSPRGKILAYVVDDNIRLWDSASRADTGVRLHNRAVVSLTWSPDGRTLASAAGDNSISLWDSANGAQLRAWQEGHQQFGSVGSLAWSPDGRILASAGHPTVRVWDAANGQAIRTLSHAGAWRMAWSPDGRTLASGGGDKTVRLWDSASGRLLRTLQHPGGINWIAWSPDGRTVASACEQSVLLWDAASGRALRSVQVDDGSVLSVAWSPDSTTVSAACGACGCVLWEAASGRALRTLSSGYVSTSAWSSDGQVLATAGSDGIRLWPGSADALLDQVRQHIRLYTPSPAECRQYFAADTCPPSR